MAGNLAQGTFFGSDSLFLHLSFAARQNITTCAFAFLLQNNSCHMQCGHISCVRRAHTWSMVPYCILCLFLGNASWLYRC